MSAVAEPQSEQEAVERWRVEQLYRQGMPMEIAEQVAILDAPCWRQAIRLLEDKCPPQLILDIVR